MGQVVREVDVGEVDIGKVVEEVDVGEVAVGEVVVGQIVGEVEVMHWMGLPKVLVGDVC